MAKPVGRPRTTIDDLPRESGIYALLCPKTGCIRYIGQAKNIRSRFYQHLKSSGKSPKDSWIIGLRRSGLIPEIRVMEKTEDLNQRERHWISVESKSGELLNLHAGGLYNGIEDPKPWRVAGVSYPTKLMSLRMRNIGIDSSVSKVLTDFAKSIESDSERLKHELMVADTISKTSLAPKVEKWLKSVLPRIHQNYPEILNE